MKANELRIGNYVSVSFEVPAKFESDDFKRLENCPEYCKPIPLTEEWLLRFGFSHNKKDKMYFLPIPNLKMEIHVSFFMKEYVVELHNHVMPIITECNSEVHQLQNLYFALTNEELSFKKQKLE